ncbi:metallophosphoesterase family protein [Paenibacillus sp. MMS20-IR301]|uniref:metallophosphoesterase family protein n=1 Tax=Paenibacillus sp. MMS20-IR301 TaxID=2895946 RepID=UPI0028E94D38|nr:metallophosphoesterase family protein [Paenibacillus sp. MMS20-IR301]WNS43547.1 metallophosphoesterase family protein [Paenibacillus sp. MMS20-IR301]
MNHKLSFRQDGTFNIVQFTDLHWMDGRAEDQRTRGLMERVLKAEQPDLVIFTGDLVYTGPVPEGDTECSNPRQAFRDAVAAVEASGTPWAFVFGNHDTEKGVTYSELMETALEHPHCLAEAGPEELPGAGNYTLEITGTDGSTSAILYMLDTGAYSSLEQIPGYNWVQRNQIQWLTAQSEQLNSRPGQEKLPALAFFHIPLPEYAEMWAKETCYGHKHEQVCAPVLNSGLFTALVEMGDVMGTFCGHDHVNDFTGSLHGIRLSYGRATGYNTYGREGFMRGARVIRLTQGERQFTTWLRLEDGSQLLEQPVHTPAVADGSEH